MTVVQGESIQTKPPPIATAIIRMQMTPLVTTIGIIKNLFTTERNANNAGQSGSRASGSSVHPDFLIDR
jgi:hypothetical protein